MKPGDIVLVHGHSKYSKLIRFGQARHFKGPNNYKYWTHVAVVVSEDGDIVEALWPKVVRDNLSKYTEQHNYIVVDVSDWVRDEDRPDIARFALHCVGRQYGIMEAISLGFYCVLGGPFRFGIDNQVICSALAAEALCRSSIIFPNEPLWMFPAHHAQFFDVPGKQEDASATR